MLYLVETLRITFAININIYIIHATKYDLKFPARNTFLRAVHGPYIYFGIH